MRRGDRRREDSAMSPKPTIPSNESRSEWTAEERAVHAELLARVSPMPWSPEWCRAVPRHELEALYYRERREALWTIRELRKQGRDKLARRLMRNAVRQSTRWARQREAEIEAAEAREEWYRRIAKRERSSQ